MENHVVNSVAAGSSNVKRYAPPNQRNWLHGRRKSSGDAPEKASRGNDSGRSLIGLVKGFPPNLGENPVIPLNGCCNSAASELLSNRWTAAMNAYNSLPEDSLEKPVIYGSNTASSWSHSVLPHLMINPSGRPTGVKRDFLAELRQAMNSANPELLQKAQTQ